MTSRAVTVDQETKEITVCACATDCWERKAKGFKVKLRSESLNGNSTKDVLEKWDVEPFVYCPSRVFPVSQFPGQGEIVFQLVDEPLGTMVILNRWRMSRE